MGVEEIILSHTAQTERPYRENEERHLKRDCELLKLPRQRPLRNFAVNQGETVLPLEKSSSVFIKLD